MRTVIVATTLREFRGSANDSIQWLFLWALRRVASVKIQLVVTLFEERNVERSVKQVFPDARIYRETVNRPNRYSQSAVLSNGMRALNESDADCLLWTTCDVLLSDSFFEAISTATAQKIAHTSHPHLQLAVDGTTTRYQLDSGFDSIALSRALALDEEFQGFQTRYQFYDWGVFEHYLVAAAKYLGATMTNHAGRAWIVKLENDRKLTKESADWMTSSWNDNANMLEQFLADHSLPRSYLSLYYCHKQFRRTPLLPFSLEIVRGEFESFARRLQRRKYRTTSSRFE